MKNMIQKMIRIFSHFFKINVETYPKYICKNIETDFTAELERSISNWNMSNESLRKFQITKEYTSVIGKIKKNPFGFYPFECPENEAAFLNLGLTIKVEYLGTSLVSFVGYTQKEEQTQELES